MTMFIQPSLGKASMALSENGLHPQKTLVGTRDDDDEPVDGGIPFVL